MSDIPASEPIDHVAGQPDVTAWRRAARHHQSQWREDHGWPPGVQRKSVQQGGGFRSIGSRVDEAFARTQGVNFISNAAERAAAYRIAHPEPHQTLDETRLFCDLLSSMPMCFNLFGAMWEDSDLATAVSHRWFPELCPPDSRVQVRFEWSPGRSDDRWLGDRTAFDAVLHIHNGESTNLIGIETKYHEYATVEPVVRRRRGTERRRVPKHRYLELAEAARLFPEPDWIERIWGHDVEQVWRDHLLALACQQAPDVDKVLYLLVAPRANPTWSRLALKYGDMLAEDARHTFQYRAVDDLLDEAADLLPDVEFFRNRYLEVSIASRHTFR